MYLACFQERYDSSREEVARSYKKNQERRALLRETQTAMKSSVYWSSCKLIAFEMHQIKP